MFVKMIESAGSPCCQHPDAAHIGLNFVSSLSIAGTTNGICWALTEMLWHFMQKLGSVHF
jgi:hypothetical protein